MRAASRNMSLGDAKESRTGLVQRAPRSIPDRKEFSNNTLCGQQHNAAGFLVTVPDAAVFRKGLVPVAYRRRVRNVPRSPAIVAERNLHEVLSEYKISKDLLRILEIAAADWEYVTSPALVK